MKSKGSFRCLVQGWMGSLEESAAFRDLVVVIAKRIKISKPMSMFVKNLAGLPKLCIPFAVLRRKVVLSAEQILLGKFMGAWPNHKVLKALIQNHWVAHVKGGVQFYFYGQGYFVFQCQFKEDHNAIFPSCPSFLGASALYLNRWSLEFGPEEELPLAILV